MYYKKPVYCYLNEDYGGRTVYNTLDLVDCSVG